MASVKIVTFLGTAPKISPELLPNTAAQIANNCKLYSGDLIPYPHPVVVANTQRTGTIKTLYALRNPDTDALVWLSWATDVDIAAASANEEGEQRFYYTGDGKPKVSTYELATSGAAPYPTNYYDLGLPVPPDTSQLTTSYNTFTTKTTKSYARDAGNIVTIVTEEPHNLKTGNIITVSEFTFLGGTYSQTAQNITVTLAQHGFFVGGSVTLVFTSGTATDGTFTITSVTTNTFVVAVEASVSTSGNVNVDFKNLNATNVECTVVNSTTFTYFSPGLQIATSQKLIGKVNLGGLTQARSYTYTWYTPWDEESIAAKPSDNIYIKEGIIATVNNIPTVKPSGNNFVRGVKLYRTLASATGTEYFLLNTLWFPTALARVERTSNVSTVTLLYPHNLDIDDRFKIAGCTDSSFDISGGIVTDVVDAHTFSYAQTAGNVADTAVAAGTLYHDVSENPPTSSPRYWGYGGNGNYTQIGGRTGTFSHTFRFTGTYSQSGLTITVTITAHKLQNGDTITLDFTSGTALDGLFTVSNVTANTFTVTATEPLTTTGNVQFDNPFVVVTISGHGFIEGSSVTLDFTTGTGTAPPDGTYTISSVTTNTFRVRSPNTIAANATGNVAGDSKTATITINNHGLANNDRVYLDFTSGNAADGTYQISNVTTDTFTVILPTAQATSGSVSWTGYEFVDDYDSRNLFNILGSDDYDAPPEDLQGLTSTQNNILAGFVNNELYFSEPGRPHAWPAKYAVTLPYNIVGIAAVAGSMLVTTESYPYIVSGSDPAAGMSVSRIDALYPCLNSRSMVVMGYGVVYSTHDGLAVFSPGGAQIITKLLYNNDTWETALDPASVRAEYYGENYVASHSTGGLVFERDEKVGGYFVDTDYNFTASWYDTITGKLYYVDGTSGDIFQWDDLNQPPVVQTWKSKVIVTKDMINMGAARIIADYSDNTTDFWEDVSTNWNSTTGIWDAPDALTFKLWVDKQLIFTTAVNNTDVFRLPTGYRSDTFEVEVSGNIRVRAIHLGETPTGLREA